jgi:hypothetical protein
MPVVETRPELFTARQIQLKELQAYSLRKPGDQPHLTTLTPLRSNLSTWSASSELPFATASAVLYGLGTNARATGSLSYSQLIREHDAKQRMRKLREYLAQCVNPNDPSRFTVPAAQGILDSLIRVFGNLLSVPIAGIGHNCEIMLLWRGETKSLEIEILPSQVIEFFGFDRDSETAWEQSLPAGQTIPSQLVNRLKSYVIT